MCFLIVFLFLLFLNFFCRIVRDLWWGGVFPFDISTEIWCRFVGLTVALDRNFYGAT